MTVLSMPVLPDCPRCGAPMVLRIGDHEQAMEECVSCPTQHPPVPPQGIRPEVRAQARQVVQAARRRGLPEMRCPSCKQKLCDRCHVVTCECTDNDHPRRPRGAQA